MTKESTNEKNKSIEAIREIQLNDMIRKKKQSEQERENLFKQYKENIINESELAMRLMLYYKNRCKKGEPRVTISVKVSFYLAAFLDLVPLIKGTFMNRSDYIRFLIQEEVILHGDFGLREQLKYLDLF